MGMGLGQAIGPQGNPALWGKERAASPGLMGLGKRKTKPHSSARAQFLQPPCWLCTAEVTPHRG